MTTTISKIERDIVAKCPECYNKSWYVIVDKPEITKILGFRCNNCDFDITIELVDVKASWEHFYMP